MMQHTVPLFQQSGISILLPIQVMILVAYFLLSIVTYTKNNCGRTTLNSKWL